MCLLGQLETQEEKEARESREAQELYSAIQALKDGNPDIAKRWQSSVFVLNSFAHFHLFYNHWGKFSQNESLQIITESNKVEKEWTVAKMCIEWAKKDFQVSSLFVCKLNLHVCLLSISFRENLYSDTKKLSALLRSSGSSKLSSSSTNLWPGILTFRWVSTYLLHSTWKKCCWICWVMLLF